MLAAFAVQQWAPAGEQASRAWHEFLALWGPIALAVALLALIARALLHRARFSAVASLSPADLEALHEELRAAERTTIGEIVPVVVERSDPHADARWLAALSVALVGTAALAEWLPWREPGLVIVAQLVLGAVGWALARALPGFARLFVSEARATAVAEEQATQEFHRLELQRTEAATGVLLFVSLFERRVVVLGDRGIDEKMGAESWGEVDRAVLAGVARGELARGLAEGIRRCGEALSRHFPWQGGDRNELPDRVVVRCE